MNSRVIKTIIIPFIGIAISIAIATYYMSELPRIGYMKISLFMILGIIIGAGCIINNWKLMFLEEFSFLWSWLFLCALSILVFLSYKGYYSCIWSIIGSCIAYAFGCGVIFYQFNIKK